MRFAVLAILFLIKLCLRRNIHAPDFAYQHYGEEGRRVIRRFENTGRKHEKALLDLSFLQKLVENGLEGRNVQII